VKAARAGLVPRTLGAQCAAALVLGVAAAWLLGPRCLVLEPLGQAFLRASQIVTMPYIVLELLHALGTLRAPSLRALARTGGAVFLGLVAAASVAVLAVPTLLPDLRSAPFFAPSVLARESSLGLLETYLPFNVFGALASDNFPAVVLFTAVAAIVLQSSPGKHALLPVVNELRLVLRGMNKLVAKTTPLVVLALTSTALAKLDAGAMIKMQVLPVLGIGGGVVLAIVVFGAVVALTPFSAWDLWGILRAPLALTASSGNLVVALPMVTAALEEAIAARCVPADGEARELVAEQVGATVPVAFVLPMLGQVYMLVLLPMFGWYVDRPVATRDALRMLATGIPGTTGGLRSVVRQELDQLGLPEDLVGLTFVNADWLFRLEKTLSLVGLVAMAIVVACHALGRVRLRAGALAVALGLGAGAATLLGVGTRALFAVTMANAPTNAEVLMGFGPVVPARPVRFEAPPATAPAGAGRDAAPEPVTVEGIRARGALRAGVRTESMPWAYRNAAGAFVGYDVDLLHALARTLEVELVVVEAPLEALEALLDAGAIDLAVGGILDDAKRSTAFRASVGYQTVHRAVLVWDDHVKELQSPETRARGGAITIAYQGQDLPSFEVRNAVAEKARAMGLGGDVRFVRLETMAEFFDAREHVAYDALLTTAEGGPAWAILHAETSNVALFGDRLPEDTVVLTASRSRNLGVFVDRWIARSSTRELFRDLFAQWIRGERERPAR
jgi:Na+/H+-dicarboxylate symporter